MKVQSSANERRKLIRGIENKRGSKLLTYFLSDRRGAQAQVAEDAVRPMYDHLRAMESPSKIDLFLYSVGGHTDVPWRIVSMIREFTDDFSVLIPYKAMSAATMIALGADSIVMGRKGELGPIDPSLEITKGSGEEGTVAQEKVAVEDVMAYVKFLREKAGLSDQSAMAVPLATLAEKIDPRILGQLNRAHAHIRIVARKLLSSRGQKTQIDEQKLQIIIETLAECTYQHGHAIGRHEAKELGLNVVSAPDVVESLMWQLYEQYEELCRLRIPFEPRTFIPTG